jgi:ribokinase
MSIVVVGSLNVDYVVRVPRFPQPGETITGARFETFGGGKGANQACAAARLGAHVALIGQVGHDSQGDWVLGQLDAAGVDTAGVGRDPAETTGIALITVTADGQNSIVIVPGANGTFGCEGLERQRAAIEGARCVLLQLEIPDSVVLEAARIAKAAGACVLLDPAPAKPVSEDLLALCDYVTPNETELAALAGEPQAPALTRMGARRLADLVRRRGVARVLVKMGSAGALLVGESGDRFWAAPRVAAVDTTAAGDCFSGAFAVAVSEGRAEADAGRFATFAASLSVTRPGAQPSMPLRSEVDAFLAGTWPPPAA